MLPRSVSWGVRRCSHSSGSGVPPPPNDDEMSVAKWNPVQRSGFKPMSKQNLAAMVARLKKERHELGQRSDWTKADWEEAKAEGLDTKAEHHRPGYYDPTPMTDRDEIFRKEAERAAEARGFAQRTRSFYGEFGKSEEEVAKGQDKEDPDARKKHELVMYMAHKIVWEVEEQYRNRLGIDDRSFISQMPADYGRGTGLMQEDDPRFLQGRYVEFSGTELEFWHEYHVEIIRATAAEFQDKHWRVRDIAYCDDMCLVFVDNRHRPHSNMQLLDTGKRMNVPLWGRGNKMTSR